MSTTLRTTLLLTLLAATTFNYSCRQQNEPSEVVQAPTDEQVRRWVEKMRSNVNEDLQEMTQSLATSSEVADYINTQATRTWRERVRDGIKYADLFQPYYKDDNYKLYFVSPDGLNPRGKKILEVLKKSNEHALSTRLFGLEKIDKLSEKLEKQKQNLTPWQEVILTPDQLENLITWILDQEIDPELPKNRNRILAAMLGYHPPDDSGRYTRLDNPPLPKLAVTVDTYLNDVQKHAKTLAQLEVGVSDAALRYARDMKHFNLREYNWKQKQALGGSKIIIYERLTKTLNDLVNAKKPEEVEVVLTDLEPKHEQYQKLKDTLARYRKIKKEGGWPKVSRFPISLYSRGPEIKTLRRRLEIEGYLGPTPAQLAGQSENEPTEGELTASPVDENRFKVHDRDLMDKELLEAVRNYQTTHQFNPTGQGSSGFWGSLNTPVQKRISQIELAMDRVRDFAYKNEKDYIYVNIPDFHGEAWFDHKRVSRFSVVVGNNKKKCNERRAEWEMPNATPVQVAHLQYIIVNPYWNVPRRIVEEELLPAMERDETYLERKNYELLSAVEGKEQIRQKPGPDNALGKVKFIFPNHSNTYMHDTPRKEFFSYPIRAFSHGCVRVQDPLDFAEILLTRLTSNRDREWLDKTVESEQTVTVKVDRKIPVFFEYATVRIDDNGWANFLADIYKYDLEGLEPSSPRPQKCVVPKVEEVEVEEIIEVPATEAATILARSKGTAQMLADADTNPDPTLAADPSKTVKIKVKKKKKVVIAGDTSSDGGGIDDVGP